MDPVVLQSCFKIVKYLLNQGIGAYSVVGMNTVGHPVCIAKFLSFFFGKGGWVANLKF